MKSMNAGEVSKLLRARSDLAQKYYSAAETMENWIPLPQGPVRFAPGTRYVAAAKSSSLAARLVPFIYSVSSAYVLEFGNLYIRFYNYTGTTPQQITSGGSAVEVVTPYVTADLFELSYEQKNDTLYIFHPDYVTRKLVRHSDTSWTLSKVGYYPPAMDVPEVSPAGNLTLSATTGSVTVESSAATFLSGDVGKLIIGTAAAGKALITSVTDADTVDAQVLEDFAAVSVSSGDWNLYGISSGELTPDDTGQPGRTITLTSAGSAELLTTIAGGGSDWTSSPSATDEYYYDPAKAPGTKPDALYENGVASVEGQIGDLGHKQWVWGNNDALANNTIYVKLAVGKGDPDSEASGYVQYGTQSDNYDLFRSNATQGGSDAGNYITINGGLVKIRTVSSATEVICEVIIPLNSTDETVAWNMYEVEWTGTDGSATSDGKGYPACGAFHKERLWVARDNKIWGSYVGEYENYGPGAEDSDAISKNLNEARQIFWLKSAKQLILGTDVGPYRSITPQDAVPTPSNVDFVPTDSPSCADMRPVAAEGSILYIEGLGDNALSGKKVRELTYQWETDGYLAPDLTVLSEHITGDGIVDWGYQAIPYQLLWSVRSDGTMLCMTYNRAEQVIAWARRTTSGTFESVAVIPGPNGQHEVWCLVGRTINSVDVKYVEVMAPFVDESAATFTSNKGLNHIGVDCAITVQNDPASATVSGLTHLNGESVAIQADGATHQAKTVTSNAVTLNYTASVIQVGLSYNADLVPMRLERDERTKGVITSATIRLYRTVGLLTGSSADDLDAYNFRRGAFEPSAAISLQSIDISPDIPLPKDEKSNGGYMYIRHSSPLPATILGVFPNLSNKGAKKA